MSNVLPFSVTGPSKAPSNFSVTTKNSTTIQASWQLPPEDGRNGNITGFKLFYKKKSSSGSQTVVPVNNGSTLTKVFTGLNGYTEYEFQVLAYTSKGNGPRSNPLSATTKEAGEISEIAIPYNSVYCYARL